VKPTLTVPAKRRPQRVLEVRVTSPLIFWISCKRLLARFGKLLCLGAVVALAAWGIWTGVQRVFHRNPDFRLQVIDLNPNNVIDEAGVAREIGLDLTRQPGLFQIDMAEAQRRLAALPAVTGVALERHLPGTLVVRVETRRPVAWVSCPAQGLASERRVGCLLADRSAILYPCPESQFSLAKELPVIELAPGDQGVPEPGDEVVRPDLGHCLALLSALEREDPDGVLRVETVSKPNEWSLRAVLHGGTEATFALGDHPRQIGNLCIALRHAAASGRTLATINLIPRHNIPFTVRGEETIPRAVPIEEGEIPRAVPVELPEEAAVQPSQGPARRDRRTAARN
jgi:hypothetical protein